MVAWFVLVAIQAALFVASALLMPKPKLPNAKPQDAKPPTSKDGWTLPVVFGTVKVAPNITDIQRISTPAVFQRYDTNSWLPGGDEQVAVGYNYQMIMQAVICHGPVDELVSIAVEDVLDLSHVHRYRTGLIDTVGGQVNYVDAPLTEPVFPHVRVGDAPLDLAVFAPRLFRGPKWGGGMEGPIQFFWGTENQPHSEALALLHGADYVPRYRWVTHAVFGNAIEDDDGERFTFGENPQIRPIHFIVRRCPSNLGLLAAQVNINGGANPAEMLYEILTNTIWGAHIPAEMVDVESFAGAGAVLADEEFGMSMMFGDQTSADAMIDEILRYIDGQVLQNPITGLMELSLNRDDYIDAELPVIDESNASDMQISRTSWKELKNEVKVIWTERNGVLFKEKTTQPIQDLAGIMNMNGKVSAETLDFKAVTNPVLANRLAYRTLKHAGTPLMRASFSSNRIAASWKIGMPFKVVWDGYSLETKVFRVAEIDYGQTLDAEVHIDAIEDVFALDDPLYQSHEPIIDTVGSDTSLFGMAVVERAIRRPTYGQLILDISDPEARLMSVEFATQVGDEPMSAYELNTDPDRFSKTVPFVSGKPSYIFWRVYANNNGNVVLAASGVYQFFAIGENVWIEWKPVHDDASGDTVSYVGKLSGSEAWVYEAVRAQPVDIAIWDEIEDAGNLTDVLIPDINGKVTKTFDVPPEGSIRYLRVRPYDTVDGDLVGGVAADVVIYPKSAQAPVIEMETSENGETGTMLVKLHDRGIAVTSVMVQVQVGTGLISDMVVPARDAGDVSVVRGGILATGEYEHDVILDTYRQSWITFTILLATGEIMTVVSPGFDQNRVPDFATEPYFDEGSNILRGVTGDNDTVSLSVERQGSPWSYDIDGWQVGPIDVTQPDPDGSAGQAVNTTAVYRITLYSDPLADVDGNTFVAVRDISHTIGATGEPEWDDIRTAEPAIGSEEMTISLKASDDPIGYTGRVWARYQDAGLAWTSWVDVTGDLSAAPSPLPTVLTPYVLGTTFPRIAKDLSKPIVTYEVYAEILDGSSVVVDTSNVVSRQWYHGPEL